MTPSSQPAHITASIVCYKTPVAELTPLLHRLATSDNPRIDWVVVDNAALDSPGQARQLAAAVQSHGGRYIASSNVGFGAGHNQALAALHSTDAALHLMLNPDILFGPDVLPSLIDLFAQHPSVVRVMPRVRFPDGREQHLCKLLPTPLDFFLRRFAPGALQRLAQPRLDRYELTGLPDTPTTSIPFLSGCFVLARWSVLRQIAGFDDRYFLYMEDVDLCRRMAAHGDLLYWPHVHVTHGYQRGSHTSFKLMLRHLQSSWKYFNRWGWLFDPERNRINQRALQSLGLDLGYGASATPAPRGVSRPGVPRRRRAAAIASTDTAPGQTAT